MPRAPHFQSFCHQTEARRPCIKNGRLRRVPIKDHRSSEQLGPGGCEPDEGAAHGASRASRAIRQLDDAAIAAVRTRPRYEP
jgi:hypothetical protein